MRNTILGGRYRILERIGEGGMAYVYVALDQKLGRKVAIKVLHEHMEKNEDIRKRFQMEAQAVSGLDHPNIVKIYDFSGTGSERLWIVTEVIHGKNLAQFAQQFTGGWLSPVVSACIVREICKALEKAHSQGIVHRDIKPENIMMTNQGVVKLMDFGIAKDLGKTSMTLTGTFMGSPSYMSPEQIRGRGVDHRSDLYSLSVLFYEIVTGRLPFTGNTTHDVVLKIMEGEFTYPRFIVPDLPERLDHMIVKGMGKEPESRYQTAREYGKKLEKLLSRIGFDESHIELERFFRDPKAYEQRLKALLADARMGLQETEVKQHTLRSSAKLSPALTRRETAPPSHQGAPLATGRRTQKEPSPPPSFRGDDTWQKHMQGTRTGATGVRSQRHRTIPPPPKQPTPLPQPPRHTRVERTMREFPQGTQVNQVSAGRRQRPRAAYPRVPVARRSAGRHVRRMPGTLTSQGSFLTYALGFLLVGLIGGVSIWGFWELQKKLDRNASTRSANVEEDTKRPGVNRVDRKKPKKRRKKRHVKRRPETQNVAAQGQGTSRRPKTKTVTRPPQRQKTPPSYPRTRIVVSKPVKEKTEDPALEIEATEIKQTKTEEPPESPKRPRGTKPPPETTEATPDAVVTQPVDPQPVETPKKGRGKVAVSSQPAAEVYIDGRRYGTTVDATTGSGWITLTSGRHVMELRRTGYALNRKVFHLEPGEQKSFPRIVLERNGGLDRSYKLTLRADPVPVQVTIRNIDENRTTAFTMNTTTKTVELSNGRYQVKVERDGKVRERFIVLTASQNSLTFSAIFKDAD